MGLLGIFIGLGLLIVLAFRGWSVLLLSPAAALMVALFSGEPLLAHWTQTFMGSASRFIAQFFSIFLLGAVFGKLMVDSGSVTTISAYLSQSLGPRHTMLAVVLAGAAVTFGGVNLMVAFFVPVPMTLFRATGVPHRLMPAAIALGTSTFTMSALPGSPAVQNAIPMPFFDTTPLAAPGLGVIAAAIMLGFSVWWLRRAEASARREGEGYGGPDVDVAVAMDDEGLREGATASREFDPAELQRGRSSNLAPSTLVVVLPLLIVVAVNVIMSLVVLPRMAWSFLAEPRWGSTSLGAVGGVWAVTTALAAASLTVIALNFNRLPSLRQSMDAGANAAVLPIFSIASLVGFGAVVAAIPAFEGVRSWALTIGGGPLVSLAVTTNILSALTGSASGGMTVALDAMGATYTCSLPRHMASVRTCCTGWR
jgi:H+/gluconate symporter-like permease